MTKDSLQLCKYSIKFFFSGNRGSESFEGLYGRRV